MNRQECDILKILTEESYVSQRVLAEISGYSLGLVNRSVKSLQQQGLIDEHMIITSAAKEYLQKKHLKMQ